MKPWLLEVNSSPAMSMETDVDNLVKPALIRDAINICPFESYHDFLERTRMTQNAKTSSIHKNFFSKRTTATNKKEEGFSAPVSAQGHNKIHNRSKDAFSNGIGSAKTDKNSVLKSQYHKAVQKLDILEQPYSHYTSNHSKKGLSGGDESAAANVTS